MSENEHFFFQRDLEVWELYFYYCSIKTKTMLFRLVVCQSFRQSFKWFSNKAG